MLIIVEGMDNTGKSTLAMKIASDLKAVFVNNRHKPQTYDEVCDWTVAMSRLSLEQPQHIVSDRWAAISEPVYGPICRNHYVLSLSQIKEIYTYAQRNSAPLIIWCKPPADVVRGSIDNRDQMEGVVDNVDALLAGYEVRMGQVREYFMVLEYDYTIQDYGNFLRTINGIINHQVIQ